MAHAESYHLLFEDECSLLFSGLSEEGICLLAEFYPPFHLGYSLVQLLNAGIRLLVHFIPIFGLRHKCLACYICIKPFHDPFHTPHFLEDCSVSHGL